MSDTKKKRIIRDNHTILLIKVGISCKQIQKIVRKIKNAEHISIEPGHQPVCFAFILAPFYYCLRIIFTNLRYLVGELLYQR